MKSNITDSNIPLIMIIVFALCCLIFAGHEAHFYYKRVSSTAPGYTILCDGINYTYKNDKGEISKALFYTLECVNEATWQAKELGILHGEWRELNKIEQ